MIFCTKRNTNLGRHTNLCPSFIAAFRYDNLSRWSQVSPAPGSGKCSCTSSRTLAWISGCWASSSRIHDMAEPVVWNTLFIWQLTLFLAYAGFIPVTQSSKNTQSNESTTWTNLSSETVIVIVGIEHNFLYQYENVILGSLLIDTDILVYRTGTGTISHAYPLSPNVISS